MRILLRHLGHNARQRAILVAAAGSALVLLAAGCSSLAPNALAPSPTADAYAVVRATADEDYQKGKQQLSQGDLEDALVTLDQASINDPDNRQDIQDALNQTLAQIRALPTPVPTPPLPTPTPFLLPTSPSPAPSPSPVPAASGSSVPAAAPTPTPAGPSLDLATWTDPNGRFTIGAPSTWQTVQSPTALAGQGIVGFRDPTGAAELDVAIDQISEPMSAELYAAHLDVAMQQVPGYALQSVQPGTTSNVPSLRRDFTLTQTSGQSSSSAARGFQITFTQGTQAYVIDGTAPPQQYDSFSPTFDAMVAAFSLL